MASFEELHLLLIAKKIRVSGYVSEKQKFLIADGPLETSGETIGFLGTLVLLV